MPVSEGGQGLTLCAGTVGMREAAMGDARAVASSAPHARAARCPALPCCAA